jgi:hypothetical protein
MPNSIRIWSRKILVGALQGGSEVHRLLSLWLFGDLLYAILPVLVLAAITGLLGESFLGFLEIKEWSFASIVFYGVSIREFIRIKVQVQGTPKSYKLDTGVQVFVVLLIASVLVLALVILSEKRVLPKGHEAVLGKAQLMLFCCGAFSLLAAVHARDDGTNWADLASKPSCPMWWRLKRVNCDLSEAQETLSYVSRALVGIPKEVLEEAGRGADGGENKHEMATAFAALGSIFATTKDIHCALARLASDVSSREQPGR